MRQVSQPVKVREWTISYTQSDVDTIREQIVQTESAKRRWLVLMLIIAIGGLTGVVALLSTSYSLYARSRAENQRLAQDDAAAKTRAETAERALNARTEQEAEQTRDQADTQERLQKLVRAILSSTASSAEIANFAAIVYTLPNSRVELSSRPPDKLFRNWKVKTDSGNETYALVGGFAGGKWVIYSNLVGRSG